MPLPPAPRRRTARMALPSTTRRWTRRMDALTAAPRMETAAAREALIQVVRDAVGSAVPTMAVVPITPTPTVEDQRHGFALDGQGR